MISFGIKEARRAEEFAKTKEQKETVLAVVSMMNIPIVLNKQVNKKVKKLNAKIDNTNSELKKLTEKVATAHCKIGERTLEKESITATSVDWSL